jgi:phage tail sheath protein FI
MADYKTPGVYVEEISSLPRAVSQVETAAPAFVGYTEKADNRTAGDLHMEPTKVDSLAEYERCFGGAPRPNGTANGPEPAYYLFPALELFFANGGSKCHIVSVGTYAEDGCNIALADLDAGLARLEKENEPTILAFPDAVRLPAGDMYTLQRNALRQCARRRDRVAVLDLRESNDADPRYDWRAGVEEFRNNIGKDHLSYGAAYAPYLRFDIGDRVVDVPASGAIAGIYARVDRDRGVWKPPASVPVVGVAGLSVRLAETDVSDLSLHPSGKSINAIKFFDGRGYLVWGGRTVAGNDREWRYVSVRRFFNMVEESVRKGTEWAAFEPNDARTWQRVKAAIDNFLAVQWRAGALQGATPREAYCVKVGLDETMTQRDILEGRLIVELGMAVVRPAEFVILKFAHRMMNS